MKRLLPPVQFGPAAICGGAILFGLLATAALAQTPQTLPDPRSPPARMPAASRPYWSPLGLPRLRQQVQPGEAAPISLQSYEVDGLEKSPEADRAAGQTLGQRNNTRYVELAAGKDWSRPLRGKSQEPVFVSVLALVSEGSQFDVGGARLGVQPSPIPGRAELTVGEPTADGTLKWRGLGLHLPWDTYDGKTFVALPVLTIRLDPAAGVWDLYANARPLADSLPLVADPAVKNRRSEVSVQAGPGGAWICGLVQSTENPLHEDANGNGIDDGFERSTKGALLTTNAPTAERSDLARQWRDRQRTKTVSALVTQRPRSDRMQAAPSTR